MAALTSKFSTRELRENLSEVLGRANFGGERIGITRNGKLAAVVISVADLETLEALEMMQDVAAYRNAKADDNGERITLEELRNTIAP